MNAPAITHNQQQEHFTFVIDGAEATLQYQLSKTTANNNSPASVNFTHTFVPPEFRGKGLAESLVREGLRWAKAEGYDITASCWYVQKFIR
jgi:predicted GNAT family acetyltransferase